MELRVERPAKPEVLELVSENETAPLDSVAVMAVTITVFSGVSGTHNKQ